MRNLFARLAFIGASTTSGEGLEVTFAQIFCRYLPADEDRRILDCGKAGFRFGPKRLGEIMIDRALAFNPTIVFAIDFLFWFVYGEYLDRLASLEDGLALLARIRGPHVIGTIPSVPNASELILPSRLRPDAKTLIRINARITDYCASDPDCILAPWGEVAATFPGERQEDGLHSTLVGLDRLCLAMCRPFAARGNALSA